MAKSRTRKQEEIDAVSQDLTGATSAVLATFQGITVKESEAVRRQAREQGVTMRVIKKTLLNRSVDAAKKTPITLESAAGNIMIATGADEVAPAKVMKEFLKGHEASAILGGYMGNDILSVESVLQLADLPSMDELRTKLVYVINAPLTGFVRVLNGPAQGLINVLHRVQESQAS